MIISFFLTLVSSFIGFVSAFLPIGNLPTQFTTSISSVWGYVNAFSYVIALDTLLQVVILSIAFDLIVLGWSFANWIIRKIPFVQ